MSSAATWTDLEIIILSEVSQTKTNIIRYHSYVESNFKKKIQMNLFTKQKQTYRYQKQTYGYQRGNTMGRDKSGAWDEHIHTIIYRIDDRRGPTV